MKTAFAGKGGSGETTLSALFIRHLAAFPPLGAHLDEIKELLRGDDPRIASARETIKTTPPGRGSRLLTVTGDNPLHARFGARVRGATLMVTGPFAESDLGVYRQYAEYARGHEVAIRVIGDKGRDESDVEFLREHAGDALAGWMTHSGFVRSMEKGRHPELEGDNVKALALLRDTADAAPKDWERFTRQSAEFHLHNARARGNEARGADPAARVGPGFLMGPAALTG